MRHSVEGFSFLGRFLITESILVGSNRSTEIVFSWNILGKLYVTRNVSISSKLSNFGNTIVIFSYNPLHFCGVTCHFFFISDFNYLGPPLFLDESHKKSVNPVYIFKKPSPDFIDLLYCFFRLYVKFFHSDLYYFLPSTHFELWCSFCSSFSCKFRLFIYYSYLAEEIPWSWRWFSQGRAYPLCSGCTGPCDSPNVGNLTA